MGIEIIRTEDKNELIGVVDIGGIPYRIELCEGLMVDIEALGCIEYEKQLIRIDPSLPPQRMAQTIMHEITHGILYESGWDDHDEESVNRMSMTLWRMVQVDDGHVSQLVTQLSRGYEIDEILELEDEKLVDEL